MSILQHVGRWPCAASERANRLCVAVHPLVLAQVAHPLVQLPSLFAGVRLMQSFRNFSLKVAQFPVDASIHVRSFHFRLPVVRDGNNATDTRSGIAAQFGALSGMEHLANLTLAIEIRSSPLLEDVERPLSVLRSNVQAIAARARGCTFDVELVGGWMDGRDGAPAATHAVLEAVLEALVGTWIRRLSFRDFFDNARPEVPYRDQPAYLAFCRLAPTLQELQLFEPGWLLCNPEPVPIPHLRAMTLHVPESFDLSETASFRSNFRLFVNAAAKNLEALHLDVTTWLPPQEDHRPGQAVLTGSALKEFFPYLDTLPCEKLQVVVGTRDDWNLLRELLGREPRTFPHLKNIHLFWEAFSFDETQDFLPVYSEIKAILFANNVGCVVEVIEDPNEVLDARTAVRCLSCLGPDLLSIEAALSATQTGELLLNDCQSTIAMLKLTNMRIVIDERLANDYESAGPTLLAVLSRVRCPLLEDITLDIRTPYSEVLPILEKAIRVGAAFPALKRRVGKYTLYDRPSNWVGKTAKHRKQRFLHACSEAGISLADFEWAQR